MLAPLEDDTDDRALLKLGAEVHLVGGRSLLAAKMIRRLGEKLGDRGRTEVARCVADAVEDRGRKDAEVGWIRRIQARGDRWSA